MALGGYVKALVKTSVGAEFTSVSEPDIQQPTDIIVRVSLSALSWTDLLFTYEPETAPTEGKILGHQAVGMVVAAGSEVSSAAVGDRVVISPIVACGACAYCKVGFYAQCVEVNPQGFGTGGVYLGGASSTGGLDGVHAQLVRVPFANVGVARLPANMTDLQGLLLSEMLPLGYFGAKLARICASDRVAVFGADPSGVMAVATSLMIGAGRVLVVDSSKQRLSSLEHLGVETVEAAPQEAAMIVRELTRDRGVHCAVVVIGAGIDFSQQPGSSGDQPYSAMVLRSAVASLSRDSTLAVVGVYPRQYTSFPLGDATAKYVTIKAAACNHSKYLLPLTNISQAGLLNTLPFSEPTGLADYALPVEAYQKMQTSERGWVVIDWSRV